MKPISLPACFYPAISGFCNYLSERKNNLILNMALGAFWGRNPAPAAQFTQGHKGPAQEQSADWMENGSQETGCLLGDQPEELVDCQV